MTCLKSRVHQWEANIFKKQLNKQHSIPCNYRKNWSSSAIPQEFPLIHVSPAKNGFSFTLTGSLFCL